MTDTTRHRQHAVKPDSADGPRTASGDALSLLIVQVMQLNGSLLAAGDALAAPAGQSSARWQVLAAVERSPGSVAEIARLMNLARQSVQRVADLLVAQGLASYEENPSHARAKNLRLTASGRRTLGQIQHAQRQWANKLAAELDPGDIVAASSLLERLKRLLQSDERKT